MSPARHKNYSLLFATLTKFVASRQYLIEDPSRKYHANKFSGRRGVTCGKTDGHDEGNMRFLRLGRKAPKFCQRRHPAVYPCV